jgi:hypothetical protein
VQPFQYSPDVGGSIREDVVARPCMHTTHRQHRLRAPCTRCRSVCGGSGAQAQVFSAAWGACKACSYGRAQWAASLIAYDAALAARGGCGPEPGGAAAQAQLAPRQSVR